MSVYCSPYFFKPTPVATVVFSSVVNGACRAVVVDACLSSPCENNSTCVQSGSGYQCFCLTGYEGANCQHNIDDCVAQPCLNGGVCRDLLSGFHCDCPADTSGE